jgi:hypothetical protein
LVLFAALLTLSVLGVTGAGAIEGRPPSQAEADGYFAAERWEKAVEAYAAIAAADDSNARAWYRLGLARLRLGRFDEAVRAFQEAEKLEFYPPGTAYNLARAHAGARRTSDAFIWLSKAVNVGLSDADGMESDIELAGLRSDPRFAPLLERVRRVARPCVYDSRYRQFDFWVGEWDVLDPEGNRAGSNVIRTAVNDCMLHESWTGAGGGTGQSINYFDPLAGRWNQLWIDHRGGHITLQGGFTRSAMRLEGDHVYPDGRVEKIRGVWSPLPDGRVRQLFEQSNDGGATWYTWFDGYYIRVSGE